MGKGLFFLAIDTLASPQPQTRATNEPKQRNDHADADSCLGIVARDGLVEPDHPHAFKALSKLLAPGATVVLTGTLRSREDHHLTLEVTHAELTRIDGGYISVDALVAAVVSGVVSQANGAALLLPDGANEDMEDALAALRELMRLSSLPGEQRLYRALLRSRAHLLGSEGNGASARRRGRPPKLKRADLELLEAAEAAGAAASPEAGNSFSMAPLEPPVMATGADEATSAAISCADARGALDVNGPLGMLGADEHRVDGESAGSTLTREAYATSKKLPQVTALLAAIVPLIDMIASDGGLGSNDQRREVSVCDVGGGRGDLGCAIAAASSACVVTVVDSNRSSLVAGAARARRLQLANIRFVHCVLGWQEALSSASECPKCTEGAVGEDGASDGVESALHGTSPLSESDVLVALHGCGGLTDLVLRAASATPRVLGTVACPCCFTKNMEMGTWSADEPWETQHARAVLSRLAESSNRAISLRAMRVINSARLRALAHARGRVASVQVSSFDASISLRNIVLTVRFRAARA